MMNIKYALNFCGFFFLFTKMHTLTICALQFVENFKEGNFKIKHFKSPSYKFIKGIYIKKKTKTKRCFLLGVRIREDINFNPNNTFEERSLYYDFFCMS